MMNSKRFLVYPLLLWSLHVHAQEAQGIHDVSLFLGHSHVVRAPWLVKQMSVSNPTVADIQALAPDRVLILGKAIGSTDVMLWNESEQVWRARVDVVVDLGHIERAIDKLFPSAELELTQAQDTVLVSGLLATVDQVAKLQAFLESTGLKFVNMTGLAGVQQVQIKVRVAEVSRTAIRNLTVNAFHAGSDLFGASTLGSAAGGALNPLSIGLAEGSPVDQHLPFTFTEDSTISPLVTLFGGSREQDLAVFLQALSENQYLRVLAEPTLVALSGEEASFLAGGEFPIPVVQGGSTGGGTSISIEYKEFGVRLLFKPTVLGENGIRLYVAPETSELTNTGAVEIQGFNIPGVSTRRAETTLELKSGQTFAMAGLLATKTDARKSRLPLLGDLPILGALFRSVRYTRGETELLVIVTASLVEPLNVAGLPPGPGSVEVNESDWEIFLNGRIEGKVLESSSPPLEFESLGLGQLKGPGAWQTHSGFSSRVSVPAGE